MPALGEHREFTVDTADPCIEFRCSDRYLSHESTLTKNEPLFSKAHRRSAGLFAAVILVGAVNWFAFSRSNGTDSLRPLAASSNQRRTDQCQAPRLNGDLGVLDRASRLTFGQPSCEQIQSANNTARVAQIIGGEEGWDFLFPLRHGGIEESESGRPYTYENFLSAVTMWPSFCGDNVGPYLGDMSPEDACKRELAALFGMMTQEAGGNMDNEPDDVPTWRQGLYYVTEKGCTTRSCLYGLCDGWQGDWWPCTAGKSYMGRGAFSLTWSYNYGMFSKAMFGDTRVLLEDPDLLIDDGWLAFASALWFHMTPQPPKPSSHDVIYGHFAPNDADIAAGRLPGFGAQIMIINGGLECGESDSNGKADRRIHFFTQFAAHFGVSTGENLNCTQMLPFDGTSSAGMTIFWDRDWSKSCACKLVPWQTQHALFDSPADLDRSYCECVAGIFSEEECPALASFVQEPWEDTGGDGDSAECDLEVLLPPEPVFPECVADAFAHQAVTDEQCRPCGGSATPQTTWPCNLEGLCYCGFDVEPASEVVEEEEEEEPGLPCLGKCGEEECQAKVDAHQAVDDAFCAPCAAGQTWWPCNVLPTICACNFCRSNSCHPDASCINLDAGYNCSCNAGYSGDGQECVDMDECQGNPCHPDATCANYDGGYSCECNEGFSGDGKECWEGDECRDLCHANATCAGRGGHFVCACNEGFVGDGFTCRTSVLDLQGCDSLDAQGNASRCELVVTIDDSPRRQFPPTPAIQKPLPGAQPQPPASCLSPQAGCLELPHTVRPPYLPWAGQLRSAPPACASLANGTAPADSDACKLRPPMARVVTSHKLATVAQDLRVATLPSGVEPTRALAAEDVDGDGVVDLVVGDRGSPNLLLLGQGAGRFRAGVELPGGSANTRAVTLGDVDRDGLVDIVVGNEGQPNVLLRNLGGGAFAEAEELPGGNAFTNDVALADFDGDGWLDVVVGNRIGPSLLLPSAGSGAFGEAVELRPQGGAAGRRTGGSSDTFAVALGDFNQDGRVDIALGRSGAPNVVLFNNGAGAFEEEVELPGGDTETQGLVVGDVDGDGDLDLVVADYGSPNWLIRNDGAGRFVEPLQLPGGSVTSYAVEVGDVDGNGLLDIVVGNFGSPNQLILSDGGEFFLEPLELPGSSANCRALALADVDGDGRLDVSIANSDAQNVVLLNDASGGFEPAAELTGGSSYTNAMALGDINGDGFVDMVVGNSLSPNQVALSDGEGGFLPAEDLPGSGGAAHTTALALGDVNNDGRLDIIVNDQNKPHKLLLNNAVAGSTSWSFAEAVDLPGSFELVNTVALVLGDISGDGALDLVVGHHRGSNLMYLNDGSGTFQEPVELPWSIMTTTTIAIGDLDGDRDLDIVVGSQEDPNVLLRNDGDGNFEVVKLPGPQSGTLVVALGDLNRDNRLDVIVGTDGAPNLVLRNTADGFEQEELPGGSASTQFLAVGDLDGDGFHDVLVGNVDGASLAVFNSGGYGFREPQELPESSSSLLHTALQVADVDVDGRLDAVIGNYGSPNHLLRGTACPLGGAQMHGVSWCFRCPAFMGRAGSACRECLPDYMQESGSGEQCARERCALAGRPMGHDSCTRCEEEPGHLYASGLERSERDPLSWEAPACKACAPGSFADGRVPAIDACFECPAGSFQPEPGSAECRPCPSGAFQSARGQTSCEACSPGGFCATADACGGGFTPCPAGTFNPSNGSSTAAACLLCPIGTFSRVPGATDQIDCLPCRPGSFADTEGRSECFECEAGTYQDASGAAVCLPCPQGSYCPSGSATPLPCPAGTRTGNSSTPIISPADCMPCELGTFCPLGSVDATACPTGTYGSELGLAKCEECAAGKFAAGAATACTNCESGKYASGRGKGECTVCPYPLSSDAGSITCATCLEGFFVVEAAGGAQPRPSAMMERPDEWCRPCPAHAECPTNTSLATLMVPPKFWRHSPATSKLYHCLENADGRSSCLGSDEFLARRAEGDVEHEDGEYCVEGHRGPRCEVCVDSEEYFSLETARCEPCTYSRMATVLSVGAGVAFLLIVWATAKKKYDSIAWYARRFTAYSENMSLQAKFKIVVSFVQVFNTMDAVYGVRLHPSFTRWFWALSFLDMDVAGLIMPGTCLGSVRDRLVLSALVPYGAVAFGVLVIILHSLLTSKHAAADQEALIESGERMGSAAVDRAASAGSQNSWMRSFGASLLRLGSASNAGLQRDGSLSSIPDRCLYVLIFIFYLVLPSVSRNIFAARHCESFGFDDASGEVRSYLVADFDVRCRQDDPEFGSLKAYFWTFFALWPVLVPITFTGLVLATRRSIRANRPTEHAAACAFLWRDYHTHVLYWEGVDVVRKLLLTSMILFVDTEYGSSRLLRLLIAAVISATYLAILALARPFKHNDDVYLACASNLLLTLCFISGLAVKLCEEGAWADTCKSLLGLSGIYQLTLFVVVLTVVMLLLTLLVILGNMVNNASKPHIRLAKSKREPRLDMPPECHFHGFLSHAWGTGQDQAHTLARHLQQLLPDAKIWLDVDNLSTISKLEKSVEDSAVFIIFLSQGYFKSPNCRRELAAALEAGKPIVIMHETDSTRGGATIEQLKDECREYCTEVGAFTADQVVFHVFSEATIEWVRQRDFQVESLKMLTLRLLKHLPYYKNHQQELEEGLIVARDQALPMGFTSHRTILYAEANVGAKRIARELQQAALEGDGAATVAVQRADEELEYFDPKAVHTTVMILYLNKKTFDNDGEVARLVRQAKDLGISLSLIHEQDASKHGCPFSELYGLAPKELQLYPCSLFDTLAVPLYTMHEHRTISKKLILKAMGAKPMRSSRCGAIAQQRWERLPSLPASASFAFSRGSSAPGTPIGGTRGSLKRSASNGSLRRSTSNSLPPSPCKPSAGAAVGLCSRPSGIEISRDPSSLSRDEDAVQVTVLPPQGEGADGEEPAREQSMLPVPLVFRQRMEGQPQQTPAESPQQTSAELSDQQLQAEAGLALDEAGLVCAAYPTAQDLLPPWLPLNVQAGAAGIDATASEESEPGRKIDLIM